MRKEFKFWEPKPGEKVKIRLLGEPVGFYNCYKEDIPFGIPRCSTCPARSICETKKLKEPK